MRARQILVLALASLAFAPAAVFAQASIVGLVKDTSGAVLPGVTVEASSPALIEKTRAVVSDGAGQYQIVNLVPGTYSVTFSLVGFNTVKREGIELSGSFTAAINADLRVGAVAETITVTGEAPIVDVQGTTKERVLGREVIDTIPAGRNAYSIGVLIPGVSLGSGTQDVGGSSQNATLALVAHGSRSNDQTSVQNGVSIAAMSDASWFSPIVYNPVATQEVVIDTSAVNAELPAGGVRINVITRDGGNMLKGSVFANFASGSMQGTNFTNELQTAGLKTPGSIRKLYDFNPGAGGPLSKDKLWFFVSGRYNLISNYAAGIFTNLNANNPSLWTYVPDTNSHPTNNQIIKDGQLRLTWQASQRNKVGLVYHEQTNCGCPSTLSATDAAGQNRNLPLQRLIQIDWTSPVTNRLLLEAGGVYYHGNSVQYPVDTQNPAMITVLEQSNGLIYRNDDPYRERPNVSHHYRASISYVTGTHAFKAGVNHSSGYAATRIFSNQPVTYRFNNGVPNQITELAYPFNFRVDVNHSMGVYAQDKWTMRRLTATGGVRFDYYSNSFPEQTLGATPLIPTRNVSFAARSNLSLQDITPHLGASYDVFGNGKTAVKASLNKYLQSLGTADLAAMPNPVANAVLNTTRSWTDRNGNFIPDCDLTNPAAQTVTGGDICGAVANSAFGTAAQGATFDPNILSGWGKRGFNWEFSAGMQQEVMPRVAVDVSYFRRWYGNQLVTDNLATPASDFTSFAVTAPSDPRLPGGGGYTLSGLYNLNPNKFGVPAQNYVTYADNYGGLTDHWNGLDFNVNVRPVGGVLLQGGFSTGRRVTDECAVVGKLPLWLTTGAGASANSLVQTSSFTPVGAGSNLAATDPAGAMTPAQFCHMNSGFLTQFKMLGSYTVPKVDVQVSGSLQSLPGPQVAAYYVATNAQVAPSLGRNLSGNAANVTVNLVAPGSMYGQRLNQLDLRFTKIIKYGRTRTNVSLDVYNALNTNPVLTQNNNFAVWQQPSSILAARFAKVGVQFDF